uniref:Uncharacterized protein n=1 Tax=Nelumbo nucifera TaxID=4432 RepID=A0A822ZFP3_NELNU|nr:TPA_asm: hypothetical protein HUJ06_001560 [Nelumbo nucifera]
MQPATQRRSLLFLHTATDYRGFRVLGDLHWSLEEALFERRGV